MDEAAVDTTMIDVAAYDPVGVGWGGRPRTMYEVAWTAARDVASVDNVAKPPCGVSQRTRPQRGGEGEGARRQTQGLTNSDKQDAALLGQRS